MEFYRYDSYVTNDSKVLVKLSTYSLVKETPKGYWICDKIGFEHWVSKTSKKRYAYPSKQEALDSFIKRKEKQIKILSPKFSVAKAALAKGSELKKEHFGLKNSEMVYDSLLKDAARLCVLKKQSTASFLEKELNIRYLRAVIILSDLIGIGILSPSYMSDNKKRYLVKDLDSLESFFVEHKI